ncbi:MAG: SMC-Scp complex subunit ScpB [Candidatus Hodarchaeales archaeon]
MSVDLVKSLKEKNIIEAALYLYDRPMSLEELAELVQVDENKVETFIEELRDSHIDSKAAYYIAEIEKGVFQLKLREEVAARLHWPFIKRSEVPRHLLKVLSLIAFKEYVLQEEVTPNKLQKIFGKQVKDDIDELSTMSLINITPKGNKKVLTVTEEFLHLFKLPIDPEKTKLAIQMGLREYALRQLQYD